MTKKEGPPVKAYIFGNGMLMVFDANGKQVSEYQGIADECLPKLKADYPNVSVSYGKVIR
jgi:hypothetical protein